MSIETITGTNDGQGKPIKTFPEQYEIQLRTLLSKHLENRLNEKDEDGNWVFTVKDLDQLVLNIMEFYEGRKGEKSN